MPLGGEGGGEPKHLARPEANAAQVPLTPGKMPQVAMQIAGRDARSGHVPGEPLRPQVLGHGETRATVFSRRPARQERDAGRGIAVSTWLLDTAAEEWSSPRSQHRDVRNTQCEHVDGGVKAWRKQHS